MPAILLRMRLYSRLAPLTSLAAFLIIRSAKIHTRRMKEKPTLIASILAKDNINADEVLIDCLSHINETLNTTNSVFNETILGLQNEDKKRIKQARKKDCMPVLRNLCTRRSTILAHTKETH